jgi:hypothetical protein
MTIVKGPFKGTPRGLFENFLSTGAAGGAIPLQSSPAAHDQAPEDRFALVSAALHIKPSRQPALKHDDDEQECAADEILPE